MSPVGSEYIVGVGVRLGYSSTAKGSCGSKVKLFIHCSGELLKYG